MDHLKIASDNYVAFTFFIGTMAMMAASVFFFFELNNTSQKWRTSVLVSGLITFIAAVHYYYMRGYNLETNESPTFFRYVDWILTVPLLLVEVIAVLALAKEAARSLTSKLVPASAAMIALGYPGEVSSVQGTKILFGVLSTIPFLYILYVLFVELSKSLDRQPAGVADTISRMRLLLIASWGVYPISYLLPIIDAAGSAGSSAFVGRQVGYTIADILAKCVWGLTILKIARMKSVAEGMKDDH